MIILLSLIYNRNKMIHCIDEIYGFQWNHIHDQDIFYGREI